MDYISQIIYGDHIMILQGKLIAESPLYRGNSRKTLFTRDGDGAHRLVSLPGEISGTAQSLMDAFTGQSRNGKNIGLLNESWQRLYDEPLPKGLIRQVECKLQKQSYQRDRFFDLRMGIKLDEDRWAAEANANYKMETLFKNSAFDFILTLGEPALSDGENQSKLFYMLEEMKAGRFWFGAGKSKGLGNVRLEMDLPFSEPESPPSLSKGINHLRLELAFDAANPILVGWNWGKVDPDAPSFVAIEGRQLLGSLKTLPTPIRDRLDKVLGGPIFNPEDWKKKFSDYLPRTIAIWLMECASGEVEIWNLPAPAISKLGKGKHGLAKKLISQIMPLSEQTFASKDEAVAAIKEALGKKANMAKRIVKSLKSKKEERKEFDGKAWEGIALGLALEKTPPQNLLDSIADQEALVRAITPLCQSALGPFYRHIDQQIKLIQSDSWVDVEIKSREEHALIKKMLRDGKIDEYQWGKPDQPPESISPAVWREFLNAHSKVQYRHMLHAKNLGKSIANDNNLIEFLETFRDQTRQELSLPQHIDFRAGGVANREISQKYGKPYDNMFMRMLSWAPSNREAGFWEIYIPGGTIKGAFRKRASQVIKTLMGESSRTDHLINLLFGKQGQRGKVLFSDAYLVDPEDTKQSWCSMDGIRIDPGTGRPIEAAKHDYLFAYGKELQFQFKMDIQDIGKKDLEAISVLYHLLSDFRRGDIPFGGEKTNGFGWIETDVARLTWLTSRSDPISSALFPQKALSAVGAWQGITLKGDDAVHALKPMQPISSGTKEIAPSPPEARAGYISHRAFGGYCGMLKVEAEAVTPISVRESGAPSHTSMHAEGPINGWDFFSFSPPDPAHRESNKTYALPSKSIKGMIRHIYAIASDSKKESSDISRLNPTDSLFGWVGKGPNNALTGRVSFSFGTFDQPELSWFKAPYPYGDWHYIHNAWKQAHDASAQKTLVGNTWRIFTHAPLAPIVKELKGFEPEGPNASYFRAVRPGAKAAFSIRFWNLREEELQRLIWCVNLEKALAHKIGNTRYLGFGSLRLNILPTSFLIDWKKRYDGKNDDGWQMPLNAEDWINPKILSNHPVLQKVLNAEQI